MTAKKIKALESYFQTDNEHFNDYAFDVLIDARKKALFDDLEAPLIYFNSSISICQEYRESPLKALETIEKEFKRVKANLEQQHFVLYWLFEYLKYTEFDDQDLSKTLELLEIDLQQKEEKVEEERITNMRDPNQPFRPAVKDLRSALKDWVYQELEALPNRMEEMNNKDRLDTLLKFLPFVMPKVFNIHCERDEELGKTVKKAIIP